MKVCLTTLYTDNFKSFAPLAIKSFEKFCEYNNFEIQIYDKVFDQSVHPSWNKLLAVKDCFLKYDYVLWSDIDSLFLNNKKSFLDTANINEESSLLCSSDWNGICMSHFYIKNNEYNNKLLDTLLFLKDVKDNDFFGKGYGAKWEQNCLKALLYHFDLKVSTFPNDTILDCRVEDIKENTFFYHYCVLNNLERKFLMKNLYEKLFIQ